MIVYISTVIAVVIALVGQWFNSDGPPFVKRITPIRLLLTLLIIIGGVIGCMIFNRQRAEQATKDGAFRSNAASTDSILAETRIANEALKRQVALSETARVAMAQSNALLDQRTRELGVGNDRLRAELNDSQTRLEDQADRLSLAARPVLVDPRGQFEYYREFGIRSASGELDLDFPCRLFSNMPANSVIWTLEVNFGGDWTTTIVQDCACDTCMESSLFPLTEARLLSGNINSGTAPFLRHMAMKERLMWNGLFVGSTCKHSVLPSVLYEDLGERGSGAILTLRFRADPPIEAIDSFLSKWKSKTRQAAIWICLNDVAQEYLVRNLTRNVALYDPSTRELLIDFGGEGRPYLATCKTWFMPLDRLK